MEPVAFTFRNSRLTAELMTPCGVGAAQLSSEPFSVTGFVQQIDQGVGQKKAKKKR